MRRPADNPFASHRIESIPFRPQGATWEELDGRLQSLRYRCCILGRQGSGKTTMLETLAGRLAGAGWRVHLLLHHASRPAIPWRQCIGWGRRDILLLDGADLFGGTRWNAVRLLSRRWGGLIAASHERLLLPELFTCRTSAELLAELMDQLAPGTSPAASSAYFRHGGNLREALREAYDQWQGWQLP